MPSFIASFRDYPDSDNESIEDTEGAGDIIIPNAVQVGGPPRQVGGPPRQVGGPPHNIPSPWIMEPEPSSIQESELLLLEASNVLHAPPPHEPCARG